MDMVFVTKNPKVHLKFGLVSASRQFLGSCVVKEVLLILVRSKQKLHRTQLRHWVGKYSVRPAVFLLV